MKAMIFAAGLGSRLKPITDTRPKALVTVGGKTMLEHIILKLKAAGFDEIVINVHHFSNQILAFLEALIVSARESSKSTARPLIYTRVISPIMSAGGPNVSMP